MILYKLREAPLEQIHMLTYKINYIAQNAI